MGRGIKKNQSILNISIIISVIAILSLVVISGCSNTLMDDVLEKIEEDKISDGTAQTYTVTYNGNGYDSGAVIIDSNNYLEGETVTIAGTGTISRTNYTFVGWNTTSDGSGTARAVNDVFTMENLNMILYAQWSQDSTYSITYDGNGSDGGAVPTNSNVFVEGALVTVADSGTMTRTGFTFTNWNTFADGSGIARAVSDTFSMGASDVTLFAQWTQDSTYTIIYNGNGSDGGTVPTDSNDYYTGATVTIAGPGTMILTDYIFSGWNTASNGSGTAMEENDSFAMGTVNITLYAMWASNIPGIPILISPDNGASTNINKPVFEWNNVPGSEEYRIQVDNSSLYTSPEIDQTTSIITLTPGNSLIDGTYYWHVKSKNSFGTWGDWSSTWSFIVDTQAPTVNSFNINNGTTWTSTRSVTLNSNVSGATQMRFKDSGGIWSSWYSYNSSMSWTIPSGEGGHWVYSQYSDDADNQSPEGDHTDAVYLDTTPPSIPTGISATTVDIDEISITWNSSSESGSGIAGYKVYRNGSYRTTVTGTSYTNTSLSDDTTYTYAVLAVDNVGNQSSLSSSASATSGGVVPLYPSDDAYTDQNEATTPHNNTLLFVGPQGSVGYSMDLRTFLKFDIDSLNGKTIKYAFLKLRVFGTVGEIPTVYRVSTSTLIDWSEGSLIWNDPISYYTSYSDTPSTINGWHEFSVTNIVQLWVNATTNNGFYIRGIQDQGSTTNYTMYYSKEYGSSSYDPVLEVWYY